MLTVLAEGEDQMLAQAERILAGWEDYCNRNWLNDDLEDQYSPEIRVKRFLDSIGYYLLYGRTDGIVTAYKQAAHEAREIPSSSCPSGVNNMLYGSGGASGDAARDEALAFRTMTEILDDRAPGRKKQAPKRQGPSRRRKIEMISEAHGGEPVTRHFVDTDGYFRCSGRLWQIQDVREYRPKIIIRRNWEMDILYDMDHILQCGGEWYDMNGDPIDPACVVPVDET